MVVDTTRAHIGWPLISNVIRILAHAERGDPQAADSLSIRQNLAAD